MTTVYAIRNDPNYQELDLDMLDILHNAPEDMDPGELLDFSIENMRLASWWVAPETRFTPVEGRPGACIPDIQHWLNATLLFSPKAYRYLGELLKDSGEFLPVNILGEEEPYQIFNCQVEGEIDQEGSQFREMEGTQPALTHLVFENAAKDLLAFKSNVENCLTVFCTDQFKSAVESFGLEGISFDTDLILPHLYEDD